MFGHGEIDMEEFYKMVADKATINIKKNGDPILSTTEMLGKSIEIPYFQKTNLNTDIPQNSGINSQFTLRGKGLAGGHLIVRPLIHMPNKLSGEDRELLMKISSSDSFKIEK